MTFDAVERMRRMQRRMVVGSDHDDVETAREFGGYHGNQIALLKDLPLLRDAIEAYAALWERDPVTRQQWALWLSCMLGGADLPLTFRLMDDQQLERVARYCRAALEARKAKQ